jgi:hypothetical protein
VPVAVNCRFIPSGNEAAAGVIATELSVAELTVKAVLPVTDPEVAEIVVLPVASVVALPREPEALLIVAAV